MPVTGIPLPFIVGKKYCKYKKGLGNAHPAFKIYYDYGLVGPAAI
jgi:hypothetical protein